MLLVFTNQVHFYSNQALKAFSAAPWRPHTDSEWRSPCFGLLKKNKWYLSRFLSFQIFVFHMCWSEKASRASLFFLCLNSCASQGYLTAPSYLPVISVSTSSHALSISCQPKVLLFGKWCVLMQSQNTFERANLTKLPTPRGPEGDFQSHNRREPKSESALNLKGFAKKDNSYDRRCSLLAWGYPWLRLFGSKWPRIKQAELQAAQTTAEYRHGSHLLSLFHTRPYSKHQSTLEVRE